MNHSFGTYYRFTLFGGSHEPLIGVEIQGIPAGSVLDRAALQAFLDQRAPGQSGFSTPRREADVPIFEKGLEGDVFTGGPVRAVIYNHDARPGDYEALRSVPRPGHADWPAWVKYGAIPAGGGHFSGRMTAAYCLAGGIAKQLLAAEGIKIEARILSIGGMPWEDAGAIQAALAEAKARGDSLGGVVECTVSGLPAGLGGHPFGGLENRIAQAVFGIPAVKGIEFGDGFALAAMRGSQANDGYRMESGRVVMTSNHCGGILGGMATGGPLVFRAAFKPTPSIAMEQESVDLENMRDTRLSVTGRHDVCIVLRATPVVEAAAAAALVDALLEHRAETGQDLAAYRQRIDEADRQMAEAFIRRMQTVEQVAVYKKAHGLPVEDKAREAELLKRLQEAVPGEYAGDIRQLYETILQISKTRQM